MAAWAENAPGSASKATGGVTPIPRPPVRHRASQGEWTLLRRRFEFHPCVSCGIRPTSLHHITPRSQGGDDVAENLAPLCGDGTRGCHGLIESHGTGWRRVAAAIREYVLQDDDRRSYMQRKLGEVRFDARYPANVCGHASCVLAADHPGPHLPLSDRAFLCRDPEQEWIDEQRRDWI